MKAFVSCGNISPLLAVEMEGELEWDMVLK